MQAYEDLFAQIREQHQRVLQFAKDRRKKQRWIQAMGRRNQLCSENHIDVGLFCKSFAFETDVDIDVYPQAAGDLRKGLVCHH